MKVNDCKLSEIFYCETWFANYFLQVVFVRCRRSASVFVWFLCSTCFLLSRNYLLDLLTVYKIINIAITLLYLYTYIFIYFILSRRGEVCPHRCRIN